MGDTVDQGTMARRRHHLLSLLKTAKISLRGDDRAVSSHFGKTPLKHLLTIWVGTTVLAINLFGWTATSSPEASPQSMDMEMVEGMPLCAHVRHQPPQDQRGGADHGKLVCPACFPLGNAASGALAATPPTAWTVAEPRILERGMPSDWRMPSSFAPHRYQARAPPLAA